MSDGHPTCRIHLVVHKLPDPSVQMDEDGLGGPGRPPWDPTVHGRSTDSSPVGIRGDGRYSPGMASFDGLDEETRDPPRNERIADGPSTLTALTILAHPDIDRVGERTILARGGRLAVSRKEPMFAPVDGRGDARPLADPFISRKPTSITIEGDGGVCLDTDAPHTTIDGTPVTGPVRVANADLDRGVVVELSTRVALLLHRIEDTPMASDYLGLVGEHAAMHRLRREVLRVAALDVPILLRGSTGTGKELVARAIHQTGPRATAPCLAVNMAAVQTSVAAAELFGHAKGAFTGAVEDRDGFFARADGGTLFLDEIGEAPVEVQAMLLRTLETQRIQPVGAHEEREVSVRLIAATDADLESEAHAGRFRPALLHRLAGYEIHVPPLSARREDIGRLAAHFFRTEGIALGAPDRDVEGNRAWLPAPVIAQLARYDWPGNVRQLRNVVRQLSIAVSEGPTAMDVVLRRLLVAAEPEVEAPSPKTPVPAATVSRKPADVDDEEISAAMKKHGYRLERAANELGISRASLYRRVESHPDLRTSKDVGEDELRAAHAEMNGDLEQMSAKLGVSVSGIRLRMKKL